MNRALLLLALAVPGLFAAACGSDAAEGDDDTETPGVDGGGSSGATSSSSGGPDTPDCHATPQPDDALRFAVASRPYTALNDAGSAEMGRRFSVFSLSSAGVVAGLEDFELGGYNTAGRIAFTPDGRIGAVALESRTQGDRGTVGVFRLDDAGRVTVVHANYKAAFFANDLAFSPDGSFLYVADSQTPENGGGLYAIPVACDGTLGQATRVTESTGTTPPVWAPDAKAAAPWRALVGADALAGAGPDDGLHTFTFDGPTATRVASADPFGQQTLVQEIAWAPDATHALVVAPNPSVGGPRLIGVRLTNDTPALDEAFDLPGVETAAASPYGNSFFIGLADPDGMSTVQYASSATGAFSAPAELITATKPQLPFAANVITRGALKGRIVMAELSAIRQMQFAAGGAVSEVGVFQMPSAGDDDLTAILGGFGLTP